MFSVVVYRREHLSRVLALCVAEGWPSLPADPRRADRVLTAPGVTTIVAIDSQTGEVVGFAQLLSDGEVQAYLAMIAVEKSHRRLGIARALVDEGLQRAGGERIDLLSEEGATGFYEALPHRRKAGFRVYLPLGPPTRS